MTGSGNKSDTWGHLCAWAHNLHPLPDRRQVSLGSENRRLSGTVIRLRRATGATVLFDATHAVQRAGQGAKGASGGDRESVPALLLAAAAAGADGFFLETHPDPARAASDPATQWPLDRLSDLVTRALEVWELATALHD